MVYTTGTGSVSWEATVTEELRFYLHLNSECGSENTDRARSVSCGSTPTEVPDCPTLTGPADGAVDVDYTGNVTLTWTPPTTGGLVSAYNIFIDTVDGTTNIGSTAGDAVWAEISGLAENTTYFWSVSAENAAGESMGCEVFSFTTMTNPFPPYCGPLTFQYLTEPITRVAFAGFDNVSEASGSSSVPHENYTHIVGSVVPGETYPITFEGNTEGGHNNYFAVYIDWNQNGDFNDAGEKYFIDGSVSIFASTGLDGISVTADISVPEDALLGETRMRVKKDYGNYQTPEYFDDPCYGGLYGQIEDYTVSVSTLGVNDVNMVKAQIYPNPVKDALHISGMDVRDVKVYDITGKQLRAGLNGNSVQTAHLPAGVYVIQMTDAEGNVVSKKFIKK